VSRRLTFFLFTAALALMAAFLVHSALKSKQARIERCRRTRSGSWLRPVL
jgi:hypothetical protein